MLSAVSYLIANCPKLETVGEHPQGWGVPLVPVITQPY
jgi:hypothetical protein